MVNALSRQERLKRGDFRSGKWRGRSETEHFVHFWKRNSESLRKIAVVTPKKTGKAVRRNRMKRIVREFFRLHKDLFGEGRDHMIRIKVIPERPRLSVLSEELQRLLKGNPR